MASFSKGKSFQIEIDVYSHLVPILEQTDLFCFLPESIVKEPIKAGTLREVPVSGVNIPEVRSYVIYRRNASLSTRQWLDFPGLSDRSKGDTK